MGENIKEVFGFKTRDEKQIGLLTAVFCFSECNTNACLNVQ
jgi:hypothetical protein